MRGMMVIAGKELRGFLANPTYFLILFLMAALLSYIYPIQLSMFAELVANQQFHRSMMAGEGQQFNIHYGVFLRHLSYLNLILIFTVPALTMKMLAEEKKLRTFDLLLTSPVTSLQIVLGKYAAALGAIFGLILAALLYPVTTAFLAPLNWAPLVIATLGVFLLGAVYAAMNLFCSSLTEQGFIAYIASVILNVSIWFIGMGAEVVDSQVARSIFEHISLNFHLSSLVQGTIRTGSLVFLISAAGFFIFLAERVVESHRWRA
ncbi:MAG: ABC transporter permease [Bdellovibrionaceae bacterium]|nr:ABC transporter permease [Pseudobdellovibrionaceae bacterium]